MRDRDGLARHQSLAVAMLWLVPLLWAANYVVARRAPGVIGPYMLAFSRWALAAFVLTCFSGNELWQRRAEIARWWWQYLILGALGMLICGAWVYQGARSTSAINMALIYSASPVLISIGAAVWLNERLGWRQALGVVIALAGVLHVVVRGQWAALGSVQFVGGDAWIVAATISWAAYALLQKKWPTTLGSAARLAAICLGGVLTLLPFTVWEAAHSDLTHWGTEAIMMIVVAGLIPGLAAYWIYGWAQKILGANRVAVTLYLSPLYTAGVAWALLGEKPGWYHAVGALLILPGVFLVTRRQAQAPVKILTAITS